MDVTCCKQRKDNARLWEDRVSVTRERLDRRDKGVILESKEGGPTAPFEGCGSRSRLTVKVEPGPSTLRMRFQEELQTIFLILLSPNVIIVEICPRGVIRTDSAKIQRTCNLWQILNSCLRVVLPSSNALVGPSGVPATGGRRLERNVAVARDLRRSRTS